ncbi:MAG: heme biosynthesis HemY N-terminal domain-containing protein [Gallionellaceae bacterium]|jgi:HemY protein
MKFLVWLLAIFSAAIAVTLLSHNTGYVQFVIPPYRVELSLTLFVLSCLALFVFGYSVVRLLAAALRLPEYVRNFRRERAHEKGRAAMMDAFTAFFEGRYAAAEKAAVHSMELGEKSGLNSIIAARAAHEQHEFDKRDAYLADAEGKSVGEATMRLMAKTEFLLDEKNPASALNSLKELNKSGGSKHVGALTLELKAQQQSRNWDAVLEVAAQLEKRRAIDATLALQLRQQAWLEKLRDPMNDADTLRSIWRNVPGELKRLSKITAAAAKAYIRLHEPNSAGKVLVESLNAQWDSDLVTLYGDCHTDDVVTQINQAERWLKVHQDDAGLLLALGKLCLKQELWGKAQNYLDASISLAPSRAAYSALGQLAEKLDKKDVAFNYYHLAMTLE